MINAPSRTDCILQCLLQDKSCRSVNFKKTSVKNNTGNCELLYDVDLERPELLRKDEHFDYLTLRKPIRVSKRIFLNLTSKQCLNENFIANYSSFRAPNVWNMRNKEKVLQ